MSRTERDEAKEMSKENSTQKLFDKEVTYLQAINFFSISSF